MGSKKVSTRGPVPKRSTQQAGHQTKDEQPDRVKVRGNVPIPRASKEWHPLARDWYRSLRSSGQSRFFEPSDWQAARLAAEVLTSLLAGTTTEVSTKDIAGDVDAEGGGLVERKRKVRRGFSAGHFSALWSAMADLGTTEAARRRLRIEIEREIDSEGESAKVAVLDRYRRLSGG